MRASTFSRIRATLAVFMLVAAASLAPANAYGHGVAPQITGVTSNGSLSFTGSWSTAEGKPTFWGYGVYTEPGTFSIASGNGRLGAADNRAASITFTATQCPAGDIITFGLTNRHGNVYYTINC